MKPINEDSKEQESPGPETPTPCEASADNNTARRRSSLLACVILLLVAFISIFGSMPWWYTRVPVLVQSWIPESLKPPTSTTSISVVSTLDNLQTRVSAIERQLTTPRIGPASSEPLPTDLGQEMQAAIQDLQERLATLEARATINVIPDEQDGSKKARSLGASLSKQKQELEAFRESIRQIESTAEELVNERVGSVGFLLTVSQLQKAIQTGRPFRLELKTAMALEKLIDWSTIDIDALGAQSDKGVPTRDKLQRDFTLLAPAIIRADLMPDSTASWAHRSLDSLLSIINIRRLDDDGSATVNSVVARIEIALRNGNLDRALEAASSLNGLAAKTVYPWLTHLRNRVQVEAIMTQLNNLAIAQMATKSAIKATPQATRK